jgi:glycosyltransferase involved in cell wall biosynthesis
MTATIPGNSRSPLVIATILREEGNTGVHTHFRQLRSYLDRCGAPSEIITPFSWGRLLRTPVFGIRLALERPAPPASVIWYRLWHEVFLRQALRERLSQLCDCVVYAQCPLSARAALQARQGPHQRVVMAVHFRVSQADEWAGKELIKPGGTVFRAIRRLESETIPRADSIVYVSQWARDALIAWLPQAAKVPSATIGNFVAPLEAEPGPAPIGDLVSVGSLEPVKNHRFLLEVLATANRAGTPLTLDIFGEGPLLAQLSEQAHSLGLDGQVRFRGFQPDVRQQLPRYRAYIHSSVSEACPLAVIEAMAAGLPVAIGDIGPMAELCEDGAEARFLPLDDPVRAAKIVIRLLESEPDRVRAAAAALARFRRDYNAEVNGPRLDRFLQGRAAQTAGQTAAGA